MIILLPFDLLTFCVGMWGDDLDLVGIDVWGEVLCVARWLFLLIDCWGLLCGVFWLFY